MAGREPPDGMRSVFLWLGVLLSWLATDAAFAQTGQPQPELRVEAGMHTAAIRHVAVSADGKRMVSASYDKTIRIWSIPDGKLQNVFRVPIGPGFEGSIFAVALSPDGKTIAVGGWLKQKFVYLIDATSGEIVRALGPNPEVSVNVGFSPDGGKLVTVFGGANGMRMFDVASGQLIAEDKNYADNAVGLAFSSNGTFATSSHDGLLRLYAQDGSLLSQINGRSGKPLSSIAFAPDGDKLAVGYDEIPRLDIFSTSAYEWLPSPDLTGIDNGDLNAVAWSKDGKSLFAAGLYSNKKGFPVIRWRDQGTGERAFIYNCAMTVLDLQPFGENSLAVAGILPQLAILENEQPRLELLTPTARMRRGEKGAVTVNDDGSQVRFALDDPGRQAMLFDLASLELKEMSGIADFLKAPDVTSLKLEKWNGWHDPKAAGARLPLDPNEMSFSIAVPPDKQSVALGTTWYIRNYKLVNGKPDAQLLWRTAVAGVAWGVNYAQQGKLIIAALGDGTIRWFRASDGQELLAFFMHAQDKRWVLWTPAGYYAASAGGEDLIGWNINRGDTKAPDFFSASRLRSTYYRPDIVEQVLKTLDVAKAVTTANAQAGRTDEVVASDPARTTFPAVLELAMPSSEITTATSPVEVSFRVRSPSGEPIEGIDVLIDGRPMEGRSATVIPDENEVTTIDVPVPGQNAEIALIARTKSGASEPKLVKVMWDGAFAEKLKPKLYAVVVGVSDYDNPDLKLHYAAKDAEDFAQALKRQQGGLYGEVDVKLLTDKNARRDDIVAALEWLEGEVTARDVGMLFMAGHGVTDNKQRFYYLPVDVDMRQLRASAVSRDDLLSTMGGLAGKALMFIDACHSATSLTGEQTRGVGADITQVVNELSSAENGVVMFASSTGRQLSIENGTWKNGAFTKALIEGLSGNADYVKDGKLTISELDLWLSERVKFLTDKRQAPVMRKPDTIPDFPIALVR